MMKKILITGGAGFIGVNAVEYFYKKGNDVTVYDNFSRAGTNENLTSLFTELNTKKIKVVIGDIRKPDKKLVELVEKSDAVIHLAAQTAVTTSVTDPRLDFESNAVGTFNVLEIIRKSTKKPLMLYSSTNKVYGECTNIEVVEKPTRYEFKTHLHGIGEDNPLDFHSPYGCSKGSADQYIRDYSRIYGLKTVVFRQSCIYGQRQLGVEDQGWLAWLIIASIFDKPITIFGDGKQVRDMLHVSDLVGLYEVAIEKIDQCSGQVYNIGGGYKNTISVWKELGLILEKKLDKKISVNYLDWRPGDQKVWCSDISKAKKDFSWEPKMELEKGIDAQIEWTIKNRSLIDKVFGSMNKK